MSTHISRRDRELLSAYLDGALKEAEITKLELRLQTEADLTAALDDLRKLKSILRSSPQARPPRHFTLSQDMLAEGRESFWGSLLSLNLVTAVASLLLVIVLIGDIGGFVVPTGLISESAPAEAFTESEDASENVSPAADEALESAASEPEQDLADDAVADLQAEDAEAGAAARSEEDVDLAAGAASEPQADGLDQPEDSAAELETGQDDSNQDIVGEVLEEPTASPLPPIAESVTEPTEKGQGLKTVSLSPVLLRAIEIFLALIILASALIARRLKAN